MVLCCDKKLDFKCNDWDDNKLIIALFNIAMVRGFELATDISPYGNPRPLKLGGNGWIYGHDNDYTHHVIGQKFDNVLMLMDNSFYYDANGVLQGVEHPNPDYLYPNLFYQRITRVREKIALIVIEAPDLLEKISSIL